MAQVLRSLLLATLAAFSSTAATAGPIFTFDLSVGLQPPDVGVIMIQQVDANSVQVGVDLLDGYGFLNTGGPHTPFAFNLLEPSGVGPLSISSFIIPPNGIFASGVFELNDDGGGNVPFGTFGIAIDSTAGNGSGQAYFGDLLFILTRTGGLDTTDFVQNDDGWYFSADLTDGSLTGAQAWATRKEETPDPGGEIPEPSSLLLLGAGLLALRLMNRVYRGSFPSAAISSSRGPGS